MNGNRESVKNFCDGIREQGFENTVILATPNVYLSDIEKPAIIAAQDISEHESGAYTGEVSGSMLSDKGVKYVIVGHSEQRTYHNETDEVVKSKAQNAINNNITPIICIGETTLEKENGKTFEILEQSLKIIVPENKSSKFIVAYEPRWAIGTNKTPTMDDIKKIHTFILEILEKLGFFGIPVIYGGGVNPENAEQILDIPEVFGVLIGSASLKIDTLRPIIIASEK